MRFDLLLSVALIVGGLVCIVLNKRIASEASSKRWRENRQRLIIGGIGLVLAGLLYMQRIL